MRIVCVSDTHCALDKVEIPEGDVLIHSGDLTYRGTIQEIKKEFTILEEKVSTFKEVLFVAGNHDWLFEKAPDLAQELCKEHGITYLQDTSVTIDGLNFYGSPWQPWFHSWAFNLQRGKELKDKWDAIPNNTDVLITHSPPFGLGDYCDNGHVGCQDLLRRVIEVKPKLHVYGHIHGGYSVREAFGTKFVNASLNDDNYIIRNKPIVVDL
jgi:Icc-related predicted phosphoesterase